LKDAGPLPAVVEAVEEEDADFAVSLGAEALGAEDFVALSVVAGAVIAARVPTSNLKSSGG
jgi:hypothetical protein